jgi:hypothetical protein
MKLGLQRCEPEERRPWGDTRAVDTQAPLIRCWQSVKKQSISPEKPGVVGWKAVRMASAATCCRSRASG